MNRLRSKARVTLTALAAVMMMLLLDAGTAAAADVGVRREGDQAVRVAWLAYNSADGGWINAYGKLTDRTAAYWIVRVQACLLTERPEGTQTFKCSPVRQGIETVTATPGQEPCFDGWRYQSVMYWWWRWNGSTSQANGYHWSHWFTC